MFERPSKQMVWRRDVLELVSCWETAALPRPNMEATPPLTYVSGTRISILARGTSRIQNDLPWPTGARACQLYGFGIARDPVPSLQ